MSAVFKNSKKKLSQSELRKFMSEHKLKSQKNIQKIDSPLAKYNEQGQLTCILCKSVVRSEAVWTVHINAKQHKQNIELAKQLKERTNNFTTTLKRPASPTTEAPQKKPKGILKNAKPLNKTGSHNERSAIPEQLPDDFFVSQSSRPMSMQLEKNINNTVEPMEVEKETNELLPEGFFDDPKLDAKARKQDYKDPVEEEWEKFLKVIKEADDESAAIIAEDQEESTTERQIDEIDEQLNKLSKVLDLEKKKEILITVNNTNTVNVCNKENEDDDLDENEFEEFLDWRSKKSFN